MAILKKFENFGGRSGTELPHLAIFGPKTRFWQYSGFRVTSYLELIEPSWRSRSVIVQVMKPLQSKKQRQMTQLLPHNGSISSK